MISSVLIVGYCCISLIAIGIYCYRQKGQIGSFAKGATVAFFIVTHIAFLGFGLFKNKFDFSITILLYFCILIILSRYSNGKILFNKTNLSHHLYTATFFLLICLINYLNY
ncbi:hypothetical protein [Solibacillus sp. CAU 1738]|uniref:hypothetical protein n=1 Tax=Solibacillus sp. CAU 1738 TaxID=3140363 RepID=UPI003260B565